MPLERSNSSGEALEKLLTAVQEFSNALASDESQVGVVTNGLVVWEEVSFSEDGTPARETLYAAIGDQATPTNSLGLAVQLLKTLERDIVGCNCGPDE